MNLEELEKGFEKRKLPYLAAMNTVLTKTNNLLLYNNIPCSISCRPKTFASAMEKATRKTGKKVEEITIDDIFDNETDIAGERICVLFKRHIFELEKSIKKIPGMSVTKRKDYITIPKQNGYSSLHLIVQVEVYTTDGTELVPVEIQLRTKAQDLWAELEHYLYKNKGVFPEEFRGLFKQIAKWITKIDELGEQIYLLVNKTEV
ncbi:hypothetical protein IKG28_02905 [Candidatus Saccharibacteria bacterium]|nr:hypothetical protein [Candidatus Saccharibacteria bacterium]